MAGHQPGLGEPLQRVRDRRPLGGDQLAEQAVRERQRQPDAARLDPAPAGGQVPQEQDEAHLEPRLGGDRPQHVELGRPAAGATQQRAADLRPRPHALGEVAVEQREPGRAQHPPVTGSLEQLVGVRCERLQQIAGADQLGRGPVTGAGLERDEAVEDQQARALAGELEPRAQVARRRPRPGRASRSRAAGRRCARGGRAPRRVPRRRRAGRCRADRASGRTREPVPRPRPATSGAQAG